MTILITALGVPFAAVCVWLAVRIVNRKERWAKWGLVVFVAAPVLYVASFGPACWLVAEGYLPINSQWHIHRPLARFVNRTQPSFARDMLCGWGSACGGDIGLALLLFALDAD